MLLIDLVCDVYFAKRKYLQWSMSDSQSDDHNNEDDGTKSGPYNRPLPLL